MLIIIWLVVEPYPSEQYENQLGLWHSQYMASHKSDVPNHQPVWRFPEKWCYPNIWVVYFMDNPILIAGWELRGTPSDQETSMADVKNRGFSLLQRCILVDHRCIDRERWQQTMLCTLKYKGVPENVPIVQKDNSLILSYNSINLI